ncbi:hypothetical protein BV25DRAFT_1846401 [Artomyces pyxidatus]|uniref:Uncharacterized protein n=1 Tax=Artomyces pyxidatus TaxID=48021 RepID=A0ACB8TIT8_9AGAM|nr:hypothetical protein BV25DRAFT_1846401 [Artomyces pyxidatus]
MVAPVPRVTTPPTTTARRSSSISTSSPPSSITRGATARSAVNPRVSSSLSSPSRRGSVKSATPPPVPAANGETKESLATALKHEIEEKEQLLVQVQNKDQTITTLTQENDNVSSALHAAEARLYELYSEQNRAEEEMAARIEVAEKLRTQVRELEKEKRDLHRRYNEQTSTFEAERQAFYDNEQHLKSRIQSLTQARKQLPAPRSPSIVVDSESEAEMEEEDDGEPEQPSTPSQEKRELDAEPAEMTALRLELSTLSTSYASLQSTLVLLQTQLVDLKRVNHELQEENESYNILLREKTLSGQFDLMKQVGSGSASSSDQDDEDGRTDDTGDGRSMRSSTRSALGTVEEHPEEVLDPEYDHVNGIEDGDKDLEDGDPQSLAASNRSARHTRHNRRHGSSASRSPTARGESLADLPITGPGLDLAAELGRAQNKDILEGRAVDDRDRSVVNKSGKRGKKGSSDSNRKLSFSEPGAIEPSGSANDVDSLRTEIKSLKDANKALSLYASKIIDRIISQEGFEHVLAVDYENIPPTPSTATFVPPPKSDEKSKRRNTITMFSRSTSNPTPVLPQPEKLTTFDSPPIASPKTASAARANRRSLSFDWRGFSVFGGGEKKPEPNPNLRPLTLKGGSSPSIPGARKLETHEDEEDRKERERLNATMKLMGIDKPPAPPPMVKSFSTPEGPVSSPILDGAASPATSTPPSRFSFFRRATAPSDASSTKSAPSSTNDNPATLTQEALAQAEAESTLAALDAQERVLSLELAKGGSGGFTEIVPRRKSGSRRSRTSGGGSGSTVWSAGMSREDGDE